jgi:tRNA(fMet)-specific endonuclease VapC
MRLLDTNIVSFLMNNHTLAAVYLRHVSGYDLAISFQTLGELLFGGTLAGWGTIRWLRLQSMLAGYAVLHTTPDVIVRWAEVRALRHAQPIGVADCWIAATALAFGLELVTHNPADFRAIPGLTVVTEAP